MSEGTASPGSGAVGPPPEGGKAGEGAPAPRNIQLRGTAVSPGLAVGTVHRRDYDPARASQERVAADALEHELNRFHEALMETRRQLTELRRALIGRVGEDDARILDVHAACLKDSVFISDVENLILNEHLALEGAIGKVITDFDRIFRLVQNETLRERAADLRDVGVRVLRYLEDKRQRPADPEAAPRERVLAGRELSIVDLFDLRGRGVLAVVTEAGGATSHAAILARSMRIPAITDLSGLLEVLREGDTVVVDASEGVVWIDPDEAVRAQYAESAREAQLEALREELPAAAVRDPRTQDGERLRVFASCGNLPEVEQAAALSMPAIGLYRTELLYVVEKDEPPPEALERHYAAVVAAAGGASVTFRLLHADSSIGLTWLHPVREPNPALGRAGVRALLAREGVLRRQLQAVLRASARGKVRVAVPFVTDTADLRRVKEILFEERLELKKRGERFRERLELGAVIETPSALLGARDLAAEADFLMVGLDSLVQHVLAADRENLELKGYFESLHPFVLRALRDLCAACEERARPLSVFGVTATAAHNLPFLVGSGLREFLVPPANLREFLGEVERLDAQSAARAARTAASSSCQAETLSLVEGFRHGYARPYGA